MANLNFSQLGSLSFNTSDYLVGYKPSTVGYVVGILNLSSPNYQGNLVNATVTFTGGGGSGAKGTVQFNSSYVTGVTITDPGAGYTSPPSVAFTVYYNTGIYGLPTAYSQLGGFTNIERIYKIDALSNFIANNYTASTVNNASIIGPSQNLPISLNNYAITNSPTTAKAWVNFNGIPSGGNIIISGSGSYNVTGVTYIKTGTYTVTFSNNLNDVDYSYMGIVQGNANYFIALEGPYNGSPTLKTISQMTFNVQGNGINSSDVSLIIFGT
jgi:hypothetical protein